MVVAFWSAIGFKECGCCRVAEVLKVMTVAFTEHGVKSEDLLVLWGDRFCHWTRRWFSRKGYVNRFFRSCCSVVRIKKTQTKATYTCYVSGKTPASVRVTKSTGIPPLKRWNLKFSIDYVSQKEGTSFRNFLTGPTFWCLKPRTSLRNDILLGLRERPYDHPKISVFGRGRLTSHNYKGITMT